MSTVRQPDEPGEHVPMFRPRLIRDHHTLNVAEDALVDSLRRVRHGLPQRDRFTFGTNVLLEPTTDHRFTVDAILTVRGMTGAIEIDGPHHGRRYAADRTRDYILKDNGIAEVYRIPVEHTSDEATLDAEVHRFLRVLPRMW